MYMADFDYHIIYIRGEDNTAADALSRMPDDAPNPRLAACALAYTRNPRRERLLAGAVLEITADADFTQEIKDGYVSDSFSSQVREGIKLGSFPDAREEDGLIYMGPRLLIPQSTKVREVLYSLAHDALGHFGFDKYD